MHGCFDWRRITGFLCSAGGAGVSFLRLDCVCRYGEEFRDGDGRIGDTVTP